jgi:hypothetical protein
MNTMEQIKQSAFKDELNKIAKEEMSEKKH